MPELARSRRLRATPFTDLVEAEGVKAYSVYNHMLLPAVFRSLEEDYHHLKRAVQLWDVSCERQVEICGPDAAELIQWLTPRETSRMKVGRCLYAPMIDQTGGMLNDPVILKLQEGRYWLSIADSDVLLWVRGLALGKGLDVDVWEPDISPLAIQGPLADEVVARVFGVDPTDLRFFRFQMVEYAKRSLVLARSGYSRQGGFELYCPGGAFAPMIWQAIMEAGRDLDIRAGCPNAIERIEGGLLSYGNDMTREDTPLECGLGAYCDAAGPYIGQAALARERQEGSKRGIRSLAISGAPLAPCGERPWTLFTKQGCEAGHITSAAFSPDFGVNVALGMVARECWEAGTMLEVRTPAGIRDAAVREGPFLSS